MYIKTSERHNVDIRRSTATQRKRKVFLFPVRTNIIEFSNQISHMKWT